MKNIVSVFYLMLCCLLWLPAGSYAEESEKLPYVLVTIAPDKFFVDKIAGGTVQVELMVPAGASAHTFEPTPKQVLRASQADIWFQIGEGFEPKATKALQAQNPKLATVDLRQGLDLISSQPGDEGYCHCCQHAQNSCVDPHFWLSARQAKIQAVTITEALSKRYPQHQQLYEEKLKIFTAELDALDKEIIDILKPLQKRIMMVSHPAYAYFCRDYQLKQLSIEFEGRDPTPKQLTKILQTARQYGVSKIFIQAQYSSKGARLIAREIGAEVVTLDPYAEQYYESMLTIARNVAKQ